jgi:hypothetical protein
VPSHAREVGRVNTSRRQRACAVTCARATPARVAVTCARATFPVPSHAQEFVGVGAA